MTLIADFVTGQTVPFQRMRWAMHRYGQVQEGVLEPGDLKVTQRAAGATMTVDIAPGDAWIDIDSGVRSGRAHVLSDAVENRVVAASHATLPRIDLVVLDYNDTSIPAGQGGSTPTLRVLTGTPTASVTLDAPGASPPALPNDALLLGMLLVPAASTQVVNANIRDRRKWARGLYRELSPGVATARTTTSTSYVQGPDPAYTMRGEFSGAPVRVSLGPHRLANSSASAATSMRARVDAADFPGSPPISMNPGIASAYGEGILETALPAMVPGSHVVALYWKVSAGTATFDNIDGVNHAPLIVQEIVRQNADNS